MFPRFCVLGPVVVRSGRQEVSPGGAVTRALLADLLLHAGRSVSYDRLVFDVWEDNSSQPLHRLHSQITRLRGVIGSELIEQIDHSYLLRIDPAEVDARQFETLIQSAAQAEDPAQSRKRCLAAFEMWRGVPYGDLADREFLRLEVMRLDEIRMAGLETCVEADLALGRHRQIVGSLRNAVQEFPFNERLWLCYLTALMRSDRRSEAIRAYEELATFLGDELGIEPGAEIRALWKDARDRSMTHGAFGFRDESNRPGLGAVRPRTL